MDIFNKKCDMFLEKLIDKQKYEYFNEFGYNFNNRKINESHYKTFVKSKDNTQKRKPKI